MMRDLQIAKASELTTYQTAKAAWLETVTADNIKGDFEKWKALCRAKADCMKLGVRI